MISIALYKPQIPPNTGNIARLCVALDCDLHIVGKTPIKWNQADLRRAGLDHWDKLSFEHFSSFKNYFSKYKLRRIISVTKASPVRYWDFTFLEDDILLFGNETRGLPPKLINFLNYSVSIPMWGEGVRSLNLANAVSVVAYEAYRQIAARQKILLSGGKDGLNFKRTYYMQKKKRH
ncbi:MAG: tRNA (cytidine(34)-2'-O)-methyltransferase [Spirochaetia bacterium]|nr:tRNA (cytidine(34)-2'-O)-methyltransferase [Spirochaetia bacterium]